MACILLESSEVSNLRATSANDNSLVISWEPPANPNGGILSYAVSITNLRDGDIVRQDNTVSTRVMETGLGKPTEI